MYYTNIMFDIGVTVYINNRLREVQTNCVPTL